MLEEITNLLKNLGFSDKEVKIYLSCLHSPGGLFVAEITKDSGIKRSTVDVTLNKLVERGFITFHLEGQRKRYVAEDPKALIYTYEQNIGELKKVLPFLQPSKNNDAPKIRFIQGTESVLKMFDDIFLTLNISDNKELLAIASIDDMNIAVKGQQMKIAEQRIQRRIHLKVISPKDNLSSELIEMDRKDSGSLREVKIFDSKKYPFKATFNIYENSVSIFSLKENEPSGIIVEDKDLAESMRSLFYLIWDNLKD